MKSGSAPIQNIIDLTKEDYMPSSMSEAMMKVLKISKEEYKRISIGSQTRYIYATSTGWKLEPVEKLAKRMEMWEWMVSCLKKGKEKGPFSHLSEQVRQVYLHLLLKVLTFKILLSFGVHLRISLIPNQKGDIFNTGLFRMRINYQKNFLSTSSTHLKTMFNMKILIPM